MVQIGSVASPQMRRLRRQGQALMMRRIAASTVGKRQPESGWARPSLPPARRTASRRGQKGDRSPSLRYRAGLRSSDRPAQSARRVLADAVKQREPAWEVVDGFPEDIAVLPDELRVIETYLAALLDESFEQMGLETDKAAREAAKFDVE
jgi:hypothetical protein